MSQKIGHKELVWKLAYTRKAYKQYKSLPEALQAALDTLALEIEIPGPVRGNWPNYGKLADGSHHCHLKKGHPAYIAVWEEVTGKVRIVKITYAGTHEKAPY